MVKITRALAASMLACMASDALAQQRADTVLIVNSASSRYADAQQRIRPYLDHFGVPYTILDIATTSIGPEIANYALIVIGHGSLDVTGHYLDATEQANLSSAVSQGSGLVNFDSDLAVNSTPRYAFVSSVFGFGYGSGNGGEGLLFTSQAPGHYISSHHAAGQFVPARAMAGASLIAPANSTVLATFWDTGTPLLVVNAYGQGRAVQWASYDWMTPSIRGPMRGLDDLVWRSLVWAARKPFVMQGMPNFLTMRVDDVIGPFWWVSVANEFQLKPWAGLFFESITDPNASDLAVLTSAGLATASVHAFGGGFFYYDHFAQQDFSDAEMTSNFQDATAWHLAHGIPVSSYVVPHFYEIGTNAFGGLQSWGVRSVATHQTPGQPYGSPWLLLRPFRLYDPGSSDDAVPVFYADYLSIPGHPELANQFFNCVTEIRDDAGYEWYPDATDVAGTVGRGTRQLTRAFDAMALATLFTHEMYVQSFTPSDWRAALREITDAVASYGPVPVTMDYACEYLRAKHDAKITSSVYDPATQVLTTDLSGTPAIATQFLVFTEAGGQVLQSALGVPAFTGTTHLTQQLATTLPTLSSISVTPADATVVTGATQQLTATGTYSDGSRATLTTQVTWASSAPSVAAVSGSGLATALSIGSTTLSATLGGVAGSTTLSVHAAPLAVMTTQLAAGLLGTAYSASLAASGGTTPYTWSLSAGALPDGLDLSSGGVISGTPTAAGTFSFTVTVRDAATASSGAVLSITIAPAAALSIWLPTAAPGSIDLGADSPVELGVKFRSDVAGFITGIRFYKASTNTGVHVGSLWTATGTLLGSATFTGETASGWQQVSFATPVPIAANTTYVASYHTNVGHYSRDLNAFTSAVDSPPLHALASGSSGGNGTYTYAPSSAFPGEAAPAAANYWVDVTFDAGASMPPTVSAIVVTPSSVRLAAGGTQQFTAVAFDAQNAPVSGATFSWSASAGAVTQTGLFTAGASAGTFTGNVVASSGGVSGAASTEIVGVASLTLGAATVVNGATATGTVTLTGSAPVGGTVVSLSSDNAAVIVPASVTVAGGATSATFSVATGAVTATAAATVAASLGGASQTATLSVLGSSIALAPASVVGGSSSTGTVSLTGPASSAITLSLSSGDPSASVPSTVTIAAGGTTASFAVTTAPVVITTAATIAAVSGSVSRTATLTVTAATLTALTVAPGAVAEGDPATGSLTLGGAAPAIGATVTLSSSSTAASVPASVIIPAGATSATFPIATGAVSAGTTATISATYLGATSTAALSIRAITLSLSPTAVVGGNTSGATLRLSGSVPSSVTASLSTGNPAVATVPATVTVAAGATTAVFQVSTSPVTATTSVAITATHGGIPASASLSVRVITPSSVVVSPSTVVGGATATGIVTLGASAPAGGTVVTLASSRTAVATVPSTVTVPAGATTATFSIRTFAVASTTSSSISATAGGSRRTATLVVTPAG